MRVLRENKERCECAKLSACFLPLADFCALSVMAVLEVLCSSSANVTITERMLDCRRSCMIRSSTGDSSKQIPTTRGTIQLVVLARQPHVEKYASDFSFPGKQHRELRGRSAPR